MILERNVACSHCYKIYDANDWFSCPSCGVVGCMSINNIPEEAKHPVEEESVIAKGNYTPDPILLNPVPPDEDEANEIIKYTLGPDDFKAYCYGNALRSLLLKEERHKAKVYLRYLDEDNGIQ